MEKDSPVTIVQVSNGFVVRDEGAHFVQNMTARAIGEDLVFRTITELQTWLREHFTHRARSIENDDVE